MQHTQNVRRVYMLRVLKNSINNLKYKGALRTFLKNFNLKNPTIKYLCEPVFC